MRAEFVRNKQDRAEKQQKENSEAVACNASFAVDRELAPDYKNRMTCHSILVKRKIRRWSLPAVLRPTLAQTGKRHSFETGSSAWERWQLIRLSGATVGADLFF